MRPDVTVLNSIISSLFVAIRADSQSLVAVGSEVRYFAIDGDDGVSAAFCKWRCLNDLLGNILIE